MLRRPNNSALVLFGSDTDALLLRLPLLAGDRLHCGDLTSYFAEARFDGRQSLRRLGTRPLRIAKTLAYEFSPLAKYGRQCGFQRYGDERYQHDEVERCTQPVSHCCTDAQSLCHPSQRVRILELFVRLVFTERLSSSHRLVWTSVLSLLGIVLFSLQQLLR